MDRFLESYRVDSPENVEFEFSLAGLGTRTVAYILDFLFRLLVGFIVLLTFGLLGMGASLAKMSEVMVVASLIFIFLMQWAYFVIFELKMNGQTPGKKIMKIRVVRDGGYPVTFFSSAVRNLMRVVDFLPAFYGLGVLLMFVSERKKRLGDFLAGTIVIHQLRTPFFTPPNLIRSAGAQMRFPLLRLTKEEKQVIRAFLDRADSLEWEARVRVREKLYQNILQKIRILYPDSPEEPHSEREALLEEVARDR